MQPPARAVARQPPADPGMIKGGATHVAAAPSSTAALPINASDSPNQPLLPADRPHSANAWLIGGEESTPALRRLPSLLDSGLLTDRVSQPGRLLSVFYIFWDEVDHQHLELVLNLVLYRSGGITVSFPEKAGLLSKIYSSLKPH